MKSKTDGLWDKVSRLSTQHQLATRMLTDLKGQYDNALLELKDAQTAQTILQSVANAVQKKAHEQIAGVVTTCLHSVFDEPYNFKIIFEKKRGKTDARLVFERDGMEIDPMSAAGGGVVDVASFALRVSCLVLSKPKLRKLLVLDEPFKFVSEQYRPKIRAMVQSLSEKLGIQFVIVTHIKELQIGNVIEV